MTVVPTEELKALIDWHVSFPLNPNGEARLACLRELLAYRSHRAGEGSDLVADLLTDAATFGELESGEVMVRKINFDRAIAALTAQSEQAEPT
jgi:hypothetical protein